MNTKLSIIVDYNLQIEKFVLNCTHRFYYNLKHKEYSNVAEKMQDYIKYKTNSSLELY